MSETGGPTDVTVAVEAWGYLLPLLVREESKNKGPFLVTMPKGTSVEGLIRHLSDRHPAFGAVALADGQISGAVQVVIGDLLLELAGGWNRVLSDGDSVLLLPIFAGG